MKSKGNRKPRGPRVPYTPPADWREEPIQALLGHRTLPPLQELRLGLETILYCAGDLTLFRRPAVAVVGSRAVSPEGAARARRLARELAQAGVVVVSGLAEGVDYNAHTAALEAGGSTVAVIGTPLEKAYPAAHGGLQERIWREHLLVSPFRQSAHVFPSNFPARNKIMAALCDGTIIVEASDTSGTIHQASECERLGRHLFILRSVAENPELTWPKRFLRYERAHVVSETSDVLRLVR